MDIRKNTGAVNRFRDKFRYEQNQNLQLPNEILTKSSKKSYFWTTNFRNLGYITIVFMFGITTKIFLSHFLQL